jgi:hypothetical protein
MNRYRHIAFPAYLAAGALIIIPFMDAALTLYPWQLGSAQWRFGALGLMSNAFMLPAAGMLILLATSLLRGHWRTLRVFGAVTAVAAMLTFLSLGMFSLDAIQSSGNVQDAARLSYKVASVTAAAKLLLATVTLSGFAIAGLRTERERVKTSGSQPLVAHANADVREAAAGR